MSFSVRYVGILLIMAFSLGSGKCWADQPPKQSASFEKTDKDQITKLNEAIGRLQTSKDSIVLFAKRFKNNSSLSDSDLAKGAFLYEETRSSFNAWVTAVLNDFSMHQSVLESNEYKALSDEANARAARFLEFAQQHETIKLTSNPASSGTSIFENLSISFDLNKVLDQAASALATAGKVALDTVSYFNIRFTLEGLRLEPFKNLGTSDLVASKGTSRESERFRDFLVAHLYMAAGHPEKSVSRFDAGLSKILDESSKTELTTFDQSYIQDYLQTLSRLSKNAAIVQTSNKIDIFLKSREKPHNK